MNALFLFVCFLTTSYASYPEDRSSAWLLFRKWEQEYNVVYHSKKQELNKFAVFLGNLRRINALNEESGGDTVFDINQFADFTEDEFRNTVLMPKREPLQMNNKALNISSVPLPASFDWTDKGKVTAVKDQGSAGTCWAFSAVGNIEGQWAIKGNALTNFSVEQIVDCDATIDAKSDKHADCGVFGGWPYLAYEYVQKVGGLESDEDYSYCCGFGGSPGTCYICPADGYNKTLCGPPVSWCLKNESCDAKIDKSKFVAGMQISGWKPISENETAMAVELIETGPLSVALNAVSLQFYRSGVFNPRFCDPKSLDHAVLIVGFGVAKTQSGEIPYWKVKNSWGHKWGMDGYFEIRRGQGTCGINTAVTTAVLV